MSLGSRWAPCSLYSDLGWSQLGLASPSTFSYHMLSYLACCSSSGQGPRGLAPHQAVWSSTSLRGLGPVALLPKLEARRNGHHRADSPMKGV